MKKDDLIKTVSNTITSKKQKHKKNVSREKIQRLIPKQKKLLDYYYNGMTGLDAAIEAGYSNNNGSAKVRASTIINSQLGKEYLEQLVIEHKEKCFYTVKDIEKELMSLYEEMSSDPDNKNYNERIKMLKLMMDYKNMFVNIETYKDPTNIQINIIQHPSNDDAKNLLLLHTKNDGEIEDQ